MTGQRAVFPADSVSCETVTFTITSTSLRQRWQAQKLSPQRFGAVSLRVEALGLSHSKDQKQSPQCWVDVHSG